MVNQSCNKGLNLAINKELVNGIIDLDLPVDDSKIDKLTAYAQLLQKWNKIYNLTAITDIIRIIRYHLLDGLTVIKHLGVVSSVLDIGSGMGVPGVVIAIWCPQINVTVLDSKQKKTAFLQQVAIELGLNNLKVVTSRVEKYMPNSLFDLGISRAFASSNLLISLASHLIKPNGMLLAMKSQNITAEILQLNGYKYDIIQVVIPSSLDKRYLLKIQVK